jgi:cytochrome c
LNRASFVSIEVASDLDGAVAERKRELFVMSFSRLLVIVLAVQVIAVGSAAAQDAAKGEIVFKQCMACHRVGEDAKNLIGPVLNGVIGRQAGTFPGFKYSALNHAAGEAGLIWSEELIYEYLPDPNVFLKKFLTDKGKADQASGSTLMVFKLTNEQQRKDVIAYLKQFSPSQ